MTLFSTASAIQQTLLMTVLLLALILSLFSLIAAFGYEKKKLNVFADAGLFLFLFVVLTVLANIFSQIHEEYSLDISFPLPMWLLWCIAGAAVFCTVYKTVMRYRRRDENLSRNSVKQAMDMFPCAVCYFAPSGDVKLCNLQMYRLFHGLAQKELQNLNDLTQALGECDEKSGIIRLSEISDAYLFPNGKVWQYSQNSVVANGVTYTEALFSEITELYEKNLELHRQTVRLQKISVDIKQLSENAHILAKEREILAAKSKLHDRMGSGLLAVRQILRQKTTSEENAAAVMQFRRAVRILQEENTRPQYDVTEFINDAAVSGIQVKINGELPKEKEIMRLLLPLMRETCVNAARHADATVLYVESERSDGNVILRISNDGNPPKGKIVPHGGLADFEKRIADAGGSMATESQPEFVLTVTLPLKKQAKNGENVND